MTASHYYADRTRGRVAGCSCCGAPITREPYVANGNEPARWRTYDTDTGELHRCPTRSPLPPPNDVWWTNMVAPEEDLHEISPPSNTSQRRAGRRFESIEVD